MNCKPRYMNNEFTYTIMCKHLEKTDKESGQNAMRHYRLLRKRNSPAKRTEREWNRHFNMENF